MSQFNNSWAEKLGVLRVEIGMTRDLSGKSCRRLEAARRFAVNRAGGCPGRKFGERFGVGGLVTITRACCMLTAFCSSRGGFFLMARPKVVAGMHL